MTSYYLTDKGRSTLENLQDVIPNQPRGGSLSRKEVTNVIVYTILSAIDRGETSEDMLAHIGNAREQLSPGAKDLSDAMAGSAWTLQGSEKRLGRLLSMLIEGGFIEKYDGLPEAFSDFRMYE